MFRFVKTLGGHRQRVLQGRLFTEVKLRGSLKYWSVTCLIDCLLGKVSGAHREAWGKGSGHLVNDKAWWTLRGWRKDLLHDKCGLSARCAGPVTSGDDIRSAEYIFWIIQNMYYIWLFWLFYIMSGEMVGIVCRKCMSVISGQLALSRGYLLFN